MINKLTKFKRQNCHLNNCQLCQFCSSLSLVEKVEYYFDLRLRNAIFIRSNYSYYVTRDFQRKTPLQIPSIYLKYVIVQDILLF